MNWDSTSISKKLLRPRSTIKRKGRKGDKIRGVEDPLAESNELIIFRIKFLKFKMIYRTLVLKAVSLAVLLVSKEGNLRILKILNSGKSWRYLKIICHQSSLFYLRTSQPQVLVPTVTVSILQQ